MAIPTWMRRATDTNTAPTTAWLANLDSWADSSEAIRASNISPVLSYLLTMQDEALSASQIIDTAKTFKTLADMSRQPDTRHALTTTALAETSCGILKRTQEDLTQRATEDERAEHVFLLVQVLRCICNLSADNDLARAQILEHGGIEVLANVLLSVDEVWRQPLPVGQAAFGAVLNVSLSYEPCTAALLAAGALRPHIKALSPEAAPNVALTEACAIWPMVGMSLDNLCEHENAVGEFNKTGDLAQSILRSLARFSRMLSDKMDDGRNGARVAMKGAQRTLLWVLCEALEKSPAMSRQLCQPESVLAFFDLLEFYLDNGMTADDDEDDEDDEEEDDGDRDGNQDDGEGTSKSQPSSSSSSSQPPPAQVPNKPMPQAANRYADAVTQVIVTISGDDEALSLLFGSQSLMHRLLSILSTDRGTSQDARTRRLDGMAAAAALCLGNLARTDEHCTSLVSRHPALVRTLIHEWLAPRTTNVRTRHAASGLLKNLCLPAANKQSMVDFGILPVAFENIDTMVVPIQANCISILRHIVIGAPAVQLILGLLQPVTKSTGNKTSIPFADLLSVVKGTDIDAIRCEGTRLVAAVAKRIYLRNSKDSAESLLRAQQMLEGGSYEIVAPLARLVVIDGQKHPLLQQESLVALTILASTSRETARHFRDIMRFLSPANRIVVAAASEQEDPSDPSATMVVKEVDGAEDQAETNSFAQALESLVKQEGAVWPQAMLQAKSFLKTLQTQLADQPDSPESSDDKFYTEGLEFLRDRLLPLLT
ncbi:Rap1 GTPase-GDP dissociation stimulator 1 [Coemansia sp. Benny D115]|nr:Rap1 GTPase-GDP dissociation stimulator 1 [Coemansia sp. Benny D115]